MFKVTALLACLFSVSAWACPDLTGTYKLEFDNYSETISVSQATENDITTYSVLTDGGSVFTFVADGEKRTTKKVLDENTTIISEDFVTCEGEVVVNNYQDRVFNAAREITYAELGRQSISLNEAGNIVEAVSYTDNKGETGSGSWEWVRQ